MAGLVAWVVAHAAIVARTRHGFVVAVLPRLRGYIRGKTGDSLLSDGARTTKKWWEKRETKAGSLRTLRPAQCSRGMHGAAVKRVVGATGNDCEGVAPSRNRPLRVCMHRQRAARACYFVQAANASSRAAWIAKAIRKP